MPQHGPDLFSSDFGSIMRDEYKLFLTQGFTPKDILYLFKKYFLHEGSTNRDENLFWLIMARIQTNYGVLLDEVKEKALIVIESGEDIKQWEEYITIEKHVNTHQSTLKDFMGSGNMMDLSNPMGFLEEFEKFKEKNEQGVMKSGDTPQFVVKYLATDDDSKIQVFGNDAKKYHKKRIVVIQKLHDDLLCHVDKVKKVSNPITWTPDWKIGDVYAYQLIGEDIEDEFKGKYIVFEVHDIYRKPVSRIYKELAYEKYIYVRPYAFLEDYVPEKEELDFLDYIHISAGVMGRNITVNIERMGVKDPTLNLIYMISFYSEKRKFKKMELVKIKNGTIEHNPNGEVNYSNMESISYFPARLLRTLNKFYKEYKILNSSQ